MKKLLQEVVHYFWIPLIMGLVSYVFFQLHDVLLGIVILVSLSAIYTIVRIYFLYRKWWLFVLLGIIAIATLTFVFVRAPATTLAVNGQNVTGPNISLTSGSVSVNPAPDAAGKYSKNAVVTLTANPAPGYDWKEWSGTEKDSSNPAFVTMSKDRQVTVAFEPRFSLIINNQLVIGSFLSFTEGSVSIDPAPGGDGKYTGGTAVTLTARPAPGYDWKGWAGTDDDASNVTIVGMTGNKHIAVTFEPRFSLSIGSQMVIGPSVSFLEGSVSVSPIPGDDGKYAYGTKVSLTASPRQGYGWASWSGTSSDTSNPTTITMSSEKHLAVNFELRFSLTVNSQTVTGGSMALTGGSVTVNPAPGADGRYAGGSSVTLTAVPDPGYRLEHWSGDATGNATSVTLTMNANKSLAAAYTRVYTLTATASPTEGGAIMPGSGTYGDGASLTLTANPASGYRFDHWSGDVPGSSNPVALVVNANKTVTAVFAKVYTLTVNVNPAEGGSISPEGRTYDEGASITLTANPAPGYAFDHWSGDVSGTTTSVTLTMNANKTVSVAFARLSP
jgi:hypothetical protein